MRPCPPRHVGAAFVLMLMLIKLLSPLHTASPFGAGARRIRCRFVQSIVHGAGFFIIVPLIRRLCSVVCGDCDGTRVKCDVGGQRLLNTDSALNNVAVLVEF